LERLKTKVALVTGGTSGIGAETVERFLQEGARVAFVGRNESVGVAAARRLGPAALFIRADVTSEADIQRAILETQAWGGRLDILFNNAGAPIGGGLDTFTTEDFSHAMDLILRSVLLGIKHAAPIMKAQGWGAIINNSSVAAHRTHLGNYLYSIAKAGVSHASRLAAVDLGRYGVTVNCISPGSVMTPIFFGGSRVVQHMKDDKVAALKSKLTDNLAYSTPLGRCGVPSDVAAAVAFLASDEGHYINGHDLLLDGGITVAGRGRFEIDERSEAAMASADRNLLQ